MTPSSAALLLRRIINPLLVKDPNGVRIDVNTARKEALIVGSPDNMGVIIGKGGSNIRSISELFKPLGITVSAAIHAVPGVTSATPDGALSLFALAEDYMQAFAPDEWTLEGGSDAARAQFNIPNDRFAEAVAVSFNTLFYNAGQAQGQKIKYRMMAQG